MSPQHDPSDPPRDPASAFSDAMHARPAARRDRDLRRYGPPKRHTQWIWVAIAVVGLLLFVLLMRAVMEKTKWTAGGATVDAERPADDGAAVDEPPAAAPAPTDSAPDCTRVVRRVGDAWTDACASGVPATRAERERDARRADAAADLAVPQTMAR